MNAQGGFGKRAWEHFANAHGIDKSVRSEAEALIKALPKVCGTLAAVLEDSIETQENKVLASVALNYVLMPVEVIPDSMATGDRYGFLDDALVVVRCLRKMSGDAPSEVRAHLENLGVLDEKVTHALPRELRQALATYIAALGPLVPEVATDSNSSNGGLNS